MYRRILVWVLFTAISVFSYPALASAVTRHVDTASATSFSVTQKLTVTYNTGILLGG